MKKRMHLEWIVLAAVLLLLAHLGIMPPSPTLWNPAWIAAAGLAFLGLLDARQPQEALWLSASWEPVGTVWEQRDPAFFFPEDPVSCALAAAIADGSYPALIPHWSG